MSKLGNVIIDGSLTVGGNMTSSGWRYVGDPNEPPYQNGWIAFTDDPNWNRLRFKREGGMVTIDGICKDGVFGHSNAIFTLPFGYRPNSRLICMGTGDAANDGAVRVDIVANGAVNAVGIASPGVTNTWLIINLRFSVE